MERTKTPSSIEVSPVPARDSCLNLLPFLETDTCTSQRPLLRLSGSRALVPLAFMYPRSLCTHARPALSSKLLINAGGICSKSVMYTD